MYNYEKKILHLLYVKQSHMQFSFQATEWAKKSVVSATGLIPEIHRWLINKNNCSAISAYWMNLKYQILFVCNRRLSLSNHLSVSATL